MERYIERVKKSIVAKEPPLKVAETRLSKRTKESCTFRFVVHMASCLTRVETSGKLSMGDSELLLLGYNMEFDLTCQRAINSLVGGGGELAV